jgi:hypothetical protein
MVVLGWVRRRAGDPGGGEDIREGLAALAEMGIGEAQGSMLYGTLLAELEQQAGHLETGLAILDAQLAKTESLGLRCFSAEIHRARGEILFRLKPQDPTAAETSLMRAIDIARMQNTRIFELRASMSLAKLYEATDRQQAGRDLLVQALVQRFRGSNHNHAALSSL